MVIVLGLRLSLSKQGGFWVGAKKFMSGWPQFGLVTARARDGLSSSVGSDSSSGGRVSLYVS